MAPKSQTDIRFPLPGAPPFTDMSSAWKHARQACAHAGGSGWEQNWKGEWERIWGEKGRETALTLRRSCRVGQTQRRRSSPAHEHIAHSHKSTARRRLPRSKQGSRPWCWHWQRG